MPQTVIITLTVAGLDTGPFNLYSDVDGYVTPFETGVTKPSLLVGYVSTLVPNAATIIRVKSVNELCNNYIDLSIPTTTTEAPAYCADKGGCRQWTWTAGDEGGLVTWTDCNGNPASQTLGPNESGGGCMCDTETPSASGIQIGPTEVGSC